MEEMELGWRRWSGDGGDADEGDGVGMEETDRGARGNQLRVEVPNSSQDHIPSFILEVFLSKCHILAIHAGPECAAPGRVQARLCFRARAPSSSSALLGALQGAAMVGSWNSRLVWDGKDLKSHLIPPHAMGTSYTSCPPSKNSSFLVPPKSKRKTQMTELRAPTSRGGCEKS